MWWRKIKMKYLAIFIISFLFFSCKEEKKEINAEGIPYVKSVSKSINKRDFSIRFFSKIELLSYYDRTIWDTAKVEGEDLFYKTLAIKGKLTFDSTFIREKIVLNKDQEKELLNLMVCDTCIPEEVQSACYMPRHMIVFRDKENKIVGYNEFCFDCIGSRNSENLNDFQKFCLGDMHDLFAKFGIKYFKQTPKQEKEEFKFADSISKARYGKK
jgi:hypothetical protein